MNKTINTEIRNTSGIKTNVDESLEKSIRPKSLMTYIGQNKIKKNLSVYIKAAKQRGENLDHCLLFGPPGLGKTTLAHIIANEMGVNLKITTGPAITKPGDLAAILSQLKSNDVLFIDEIHRLSKPIEEVLYSAMEDFAIDLVIGSGQQSKSMRIPIPPFTLIGATTHAGLLSAPLRDRFGIIFHMDFYSNEELELIVRNSAEKMSVTIDDEGAAEIASRSRGTPRLANRWLKRVRDFADVNSNGVISRDVAINALDAIDVDSVGLDYNDKRILLCIIDQFNGGPVGLSTLSASIGVEEDIIADVYEPYLILKGYINRTPKGREATKSAYEHFNRSYNEG